MKGNITKKDLLKKIDEVLNKNFVSYNKNLSEKIKFRLSKKYKLFKVFRMD